jgi:DNA sulfur modification protein DndD
VEDRRRNIERKGIGCERLILKSITLRDFGVFEGERTLQLTPLNIDGVSRPIILFSGDNGSGKTTLFEAITLCIYGQYFRGHRLNRADYEEYLKQRIHETPTGAQKDSASVQMAFSYVEYGVETSLELTRSWRTNKNGRVFEELELIATADGSSRWHITQPDQFLLNLFPLGVSQLLFFDGERIKSFAESKDTNRLLREGFFAMTGIDNVRKAWRDLTLYSTRLKGKETGDSKGRLHELDQEITKLRKKRDRIHERIGNISSEIRLAQGGVSEDEQRLAREGAEYASRRHELLREEVLLDHGRSELRREISRLCDGLLPFAFATSLVEQTVETLLKERETLAARNSAITAKQIRLALNEERKRGSSR